MPNQQSQVNQQNQQNQQNQPNQYHEYNEQEFNSLPWAQDFLNADPQSKEFSNAMAEADKYYGPEWTDKQLNDWGIQFEKEIENGNITPEQLPDNSPIQKEAEQITDNNPHNDEVRNDAVEDFIKQMQAQSPTKQEEDEAAYRQQLNDMQLADEASNIDNYDMLHFTPEEDKPTDFMWSPGAFMRKDIGDSVRLINSYPTSQRRAALELLARIKSGEIDVDQYSEDLKKANPWMTEEMFDAISSIASNDNKSGRIPVISKSLKRNKMSTEPETELTAKELPEIDDTVEVNLSKKEQSDLDAARALYDNINNAIDEMATMGKSKKSKAEKEADKAWLEEQELRDQVKMNPGKFLPEPYKQLVKAEPRDVDSYWEKVDNEYPFENEVEDVQYTIRDDDDNNNEQKPEKPEMPTAGETFVIPQIKGKFYEPKTFGYDKPQINAGNINSVDNSLTLDNNNGYHTVAGGTTSKPSFSGSTGGASYTGGVVSPSTPNTKSSTPGRSFGGGHINLVGSGSNPVASASASNSGGVTSGAVVRSSDPNMSKGGHLSESRTQLPNGWANNQVPGGNLDISAGADYQDKDAMTSKGSLLSAKLEMILQEDSQTWDGNNSGDKYAPYVFFVGDGGQFYVQKGRERHALKNIDDNEANELLTILTSNK